jgi:diacylglycerol kinase family enzyme
MRLEVQNSRTNSTESIRTGAPLIAIGKRPFYGNRFKVCPGAQPAQGPMEVVVFDFKRKCSVVLHILPLWMGWHRWINRFHGNKQGFPIKHFQADCCILTAQKPFDYHIDGELIIPQQKPAGKLVVSISIIEEAISFLVPKAYFPSSQG